MFPGAGSLTEVGVVFLQFFNVADKIEKSLITGLLVIFRFLHQHGEVRLPRLSCRHGGGVLVVPGEVEDPVDQAGDWEVHRFFSQSRQEILECCQLAIDNRIFLRFPVFLQISFHRPIKSNVFPAVRIFLEFRHHDGQLPVLHAADGRL